MLHHLAVVVADLDRAERFWVELLHLRVLRRWTDDVGAPRSLWVDVGNGVFLAIEKAAAEGPRRADAAPGYHCVALAIAKEEREATRARLAAAGFPVERESPFTLYVRDPDGNLVGLSHFPHGKDEP